MDARSLRPSTTFAAAATSALSSSANVAFLSSASSSSSELLSSPDPSSSSSSPESSFPALRFWTASATFCGTFGNPGSVGGVDRVYIAAILPYARLLITTKWFPRLERISTE